MTPLEDLEQFFDRQSLAASQRNARRHQTSKETTPTPTTTSAGGEDGEEGEWDDEAEGRGHEFALVTDLGRKWVLAVATRNDLDVSLVATYFACLDDVVLMGCVLDVREEEGWRVMGWELGRVDIEDSVIGRWLLHGYVLLGCRWMTRTSSSLVCHDRRGE